MEGNRLKTILSNLGYRQTDIAVMLGMTQQNLSAIFKSADVRSGILEKIAEGTGHDMSMFYNIPAGGMVMNNNANVVNAANKDINYNSDEVIRMMNEQLRTKDRQIEGLIAALNR